MAQQTAVEFLLTELDIAKLIAREKLTMAAEIVRQAKQMEKEQMIKSWYNGYENQSPMIDEDNCGQTYYNETYGENKD